MQRLGFPGLRSVAGSGALKPSAAKPAQMASEFTGYGSFANLKITAEKLVKEQASVKTDLEMAQGKLKKASDQIHALEAKLQQAVNENAKLRVKQTEYAKLWQGLDSKITSTKTMCDQLTETLQKLADQTRKAEEDKKFYEDKFDTCSRYFDEVNVLLNETSSKLTSAEQKIEAGKQEMIALRHEKEEMEKSYSNQLSSLSLINMDKDAAIKQLESNVEENKVQLQALNFQLQSMDNEMKLKEQTCVSLRACLENVESEKNHVEQKTRDITLRFEQAFQEKKKLEALLYNLTNKVVELNNENGTVSDYICSLISAFEKYDGLIRQEKMLIANSSQRRFEQLQNKFVQAKLESNDLKVEIEELKFKNVELQKAQEFIMVQHAEECRVTEDRIRKLESEAENTASKRDELEKLTSEMKERIAYLTEASEQAENYEQRLLVKISELESDKKDVEGKLSLAMEENLKQLEMLQNEIANRDQQLDLLNSQVSQLRGVMEEKEQAYALLIEKQKHLEAEKLQTEASLSTTEGQLLEAKRQYDIMLEHKQLELSKHLKELSQKNDQAINEIRRKYEVEKVEIVNAEKEKSEKLVQEIEKRCEEKISDNKADAERYMMRVKEEHSAMVCRIQQGFNEKETDLRAKHKEELQHIQIHAANEMRERLTLLREEHAIQMKTLRVHHEEEYNKLQEELEQQKSKEDKQRALLQLQWKVMGESQQVDQEINSKPKKDYSVSSMKMADSYGRKQHLVSVTSPESKRKDADLSGMLQSPIANILKKVEKRTPQNITKHRKVTHHEYEVETSNGGITKRRKTRSTIMFGEPNTQRSTHGKSSEVTNDMAKFRKVVGGPHNHPTHLGDLFSEGSLNPYAEDPYAFG